MQDDLIRHGFVHAKRRLRVLVVDDMYDTAFLLGLIVKRMGHAVRIAHDGTTAVSIAGSFLPEVVFMDISMPEKNGYDACREMRLLPWGRRATIVAVTSRDGADDEDRSLRAGFDRHIIKPLEFPLLRNILRDVEEGSDDRPPQGGLPS
jgi:CheY-like chemotaxis protein